MLSESKINGSVAYQVSQNINPETIKPTSIYSCASCKYQLFTNLDILFHERDRNAITTLDPDQLSTKSNNKKFTFNVNGHGNTSHKHTRQNSIAQLEKIRDGEIDDRSDVATIVNFNSTVNKQRHKDSLIFHDPVTGLKKHEYRC